MRRCELSTGIPEEAENMKLAWTPSCAAAQHMDERAAWHSLAVILEEYRRSTVAQSLTVGQLACLLLREGSAAAYGRAKEDREECDVENLHS